MGAQVTQDLLVELLGIWQEMAKQLEIMQQMLQVAMVQLEVMRVGGIDLVSQAEAMCQIRSGVGSEDPRGQVEIGKGVGNGVKGPCPGGFGEVPGSR